MKLFIAQYRNIHNDKTYEVVISNKKNIGDAREMAWRPTLFNMAIENMGCWEDEVRVKVIEK